MKKSIASFLVFCLLFQGTLQAITYRERDLPSEADIGIFAKTYYHTSPTIPQTKAAIIDLTFKLCRTKDDILRSRSPHLPKAQALAEEIKAAQQLAMPPWWTALFDTWIQIHDNKNRCRHAAAAKKCFAPDMVQQDKQVLLWLLTTLNDPKLTDDFVAAFTRIPAAAPAGQGPIPPLTRATFLQNCAQVLMRVDTQKRKDILRGTFKIAKEGMSGPHVYYIMTALNDTPEASDQEIALHFMAQSYRPQSLGVELYDLNHLFMREHPQNRAPLAQVMKVVASHQMTGRDMIDLFSHLSSMQANGSLAPLLELNSILDLQDMAPSVALPLIEELRSTLQNIASLRAEEFEIIKKVLKRTFNKSASPEDRATLSPKMIKAFIPNAKTAYVPSSWQALDDTLKSLSIYPLLPRPQDRGVLILDLWDHHTRLLQSPYRDWREVNSQNHLKRLLLAKEFINKEMDPQTILAIAHAFSIYEPQAFPRPQQGWGQVPSYNPSLHIHLDHLRALFSLENPSSFLAGRALSLSMILRKDPLCLAQPPIRDISELDQFLEQEYHTVHALFPEGQLKRPDFLSLYEVRLGLSNESKAFLHETLLPTLPSHLPYVTRYNLLKRIFILFANSTDSDVHAFSKHFTAARKAMQPLSMDPVEKINFILTEDGKETRIKGGDRAEVIAHCAPLFQPWMSRATMNAIITPLSLTISSQGRNRRADFEAYLWSNVTALFPHFAQDQTDPEIFINLLQYFVESTAVRWNSAPNISINESMDIITRLKTALPGALPGEELIRLFNTFCTKTPAISRHYHPQDRPLTQDIWAVYESLISPRMHLHVMEAFFNDLASVLENYQGVGGGMPPAWSDIPTLLPSLLELIHADTSPHDIQTIFRQLLSLRSRLSIREIQQRAILVHQRLSQEVMEGTLLETQRLERTLQLIDNPRAQLVGLATQHPGAGAEVTGQEAIWRQREVFHREYEEAATRSPTAQVISRHLPHPQQSEEAVKQALDQAGGLIEQALQGGGISRAQRFHLEVAREAFPYILRRQSFQPKPSMPTFAQMVGLLYNLTRMVNPDLRPAITYRISQGFSKFQSIFPELAGNFATAGEFLANPLGQQWVNDLWHFYQGHDVEFHHRQARLFPDQRRWIRDLPYHLVTPMRDEMIASAITYAFTENMATPPLTHYAFAKVKALFPDVTASYNETQGQAFLASPVGDSFIRFVKKKMWEHHDGPQSGEKNITFSHPLLNAQQEAWLARLYQSLPYRFYQLDNSIQRHLTQLKLESVAAFIDAGFMCMRSHCRGLDNPAEAHSPACTDGGYLHFLRGVLEQLRLKYDLTGDSALDAVQFIECT